MLCFREICFRWATGMIALVVFGSTMSHAAYCRPGRLEISPTSGRGYACGGIRVKNTDSCWYRVQAMGRAYNPPDLSAETSSTYNQMCNGAGCCPTNNTAGPGAFCDCLFDLPVQLSPNSSATSTGGVLRNCDGCGSGSVNDCDFGTCSVTKETCAINDPCGPSDGTCRFPCTEAYVTDARVTCVSADGSHWVRIDYAMDTCAGSSPALPCGRCMPAQGELQGALCVNREPSPRCKIDETTGEVIITVHGPYIPDACNFPIQAPVLGP